MIEKSMLDDLDLRLLDELENHGLQKPSVMASKLGISARTVYWRISRMRRKKIFQVVPIPNIVLLGYNAWAEIGVTVEPGYTDAVAKRLVKHPSTYFVGLSFGEFDIIVSVLFETFDELNFFINLELTTIEGIRATEVMVLMRPVKYYSLSWPSPVPKEDGIGWRYPDDINDVYKYKIDEMDRRIIEVFRKDGFISIAALKNKLSKAESTLRKHVRNIMDRGFFIRQIVPNPSVLQYEAWATIGIRVKNQQAHKVLENVLKNPAVYSACTSLGRFNVVLFARFHDIDLLSLFTQVELPKIEGIDSSTTFLYTKPLKYHGIDWSSK